MNRTESNRRYREARAAVKIRAHVEAGKPVPVRRAPSTEPKPVWKGKVVEWRDPERDPPPPPDRNTLPELDDAEIDFVRDAIAFSLGLSRTPSPEPGEIERLLRSGEAHRILGIMNEGDTVSSTVHRVQVAIVDFRERVEAEARNARKAS